MLAASIKHDYNDTATVLFLLPISTKQSNTITYNIEHPMRAWSREGWSQQAHCQ